MKFKKRVITLEKRISEFENRMAELEAKIQPLNPNDEDKLKETSKKFASIFSEDKNLS